MKLLRNTHNCSQFILTGSISYKNIKTNTKYIYNDNNQIHQQIINGSIIEFTYTKYGQLKSKRMIKNNKTSEKKGM